MYIHINDRSRLDDIACIIPAKDGQKHRQLTYREWLVEKEHMFPRADIVLVNATNSGKEYCLYVTKDGFSGDLVIMDFLSPAQIEQVNEIAIRMRKNAIEFPPSNVYIY